MYLGDSWFSSVKAEKLVALASDQEIFVVKTYHARCPEACIEEKTRNFPGGTWIVLEERTKKEVDLLPIGYKYNKSTILTFVVTKGAGSTAARKLYEALFPDI